MFVLVYWINYESTSIVEENDLVPNVEEGNCTSVVYKDGFQYEAKVMKKSHDKDFLKNLNVSKEGELLRREKPKYMKHPSTLKNGILKEKEKAKKHKKTEETYSMNKNLYNSSSIFESDSDKEKAGNEKSKDTSMNRSKSKFVMKKSVMEKSKNEQRNDTYERDDDIERLLMSDSFNSILGSDSDKEKTENEYSEDRSIKPSNSKFVMKKGVMGTSRNEKRNQRNDVEKLLSDDELEKIESEHEVSEFDKEGQRARKEEGTDIRNVISGKRRRESGETTEENESEGDSSKKENYRDNEELRNMQEIKKKRKRMQPDQNSMICRDMRIERIKELQKELKQLKRLVVEDRRLKRNTGNNSDENEEENPLTMCRKGGNGRSQLCNIYNVWLDQADLTHLQRYYYSPKEMTRRLLKLLVGSSNLINMCARGKSKNSSPIPEDIMDAVGYYVNKKCSFKLKPAEFTACVNMMCATIRNPKI